MDTPTNQEFFIPTSADSDQSIFNRSTLIFPVVSLANVPQLTVDLFINGTLLGPIDKVGLLDPAYHIPVIGAIDHPSDIPPSSHFLDQITTPIEVYQTRDKLYTFVQQRSPVFKAKKKEFVLELTKWISTAGFTSVLVLVSVDAASRTDEHLRHPSMVYEHCVGADSRAASDLRRRIRARYAVFRPEKSADSPAFSAGGLAARLLTALATDPDPEVNALICYVAEGDNRLDAKSLAREVLSVLSPAHSDSLPASLDNFVEPLSWKASDSYQDRTREDLFG